MSLILTVNGPETIWLIADRRLSSNGRVVKDDARKVMFLETADGVGILGYAGLGATALGTEPADWMSAVLRGRNLPFENSLSVLAQALKKEFPRHLLRIPGASGPVHSIVITAFVRNEVRLYTIDLVFAPDRKTYRFRYTRHVSPLPPSAPRTPRIGIAGSGARYLLRDKKWLRSVLRIIKAHDRGQVPTSAVTERLASLNHEVHLADNSVGPRCIVAWRHRTGGVHRGGGADCAYTGTAREANTAWLPTIGNGQDISAITRTLLTHIKFSTPGEPPLELDIEKLNTELARLPNGPDEKLR